MQLFHSKGEKNTIPLSGNPFREKRKRKYWGKKRKILSPRRAGRGQVCVALCEEEKQKNQQTNKRQIPLKGWRRFVSIGRVGATLTAKFLNGYLLGSIAMNFQNGFPWIATSFTDLVDLSNAISLKRFCFFLVHIFFLNV